MAAVEMNPDEVAEVKLQQLASYYEHIRDFTRTSNELEVDLLYYLLKKMAIMEKDIRKLKEINNGKF